MTTTPSQTNSNTTNTTTRTQRILIVDDDPAILEATSLILEEFGYSVDSTVNGNTIYKMENNFPDLLILDIWMSGQDGREICKYLKKTEATKKIPILMISASNDIAKSAKESGADDFLAKPFDINTLLEKVRKYLGEAS